MATGVTKSKLKVVPSRTITDEIPLPRANAAVSLTYEGKMDVESILQPTSQAFLKVDKQGNVKGAGTAKPNTLIVGDNYFALKHLLHASASKVDLIYLDPPFGTGFAFQSRSLDHAYRDDMALAPYLEFMRRRLVLMRELLSDRGSIYLHIGHQQVFHLKVILDEVFGRENFRNLIVRRKCSSKNYTRKQYANLNDYILFYSKTSEYTWNQPSQPASKEWIDREYSFHDNKGRYKLVPVHAPGTRNGECGKPWRGKLPPKGKHWQFLPSKLDEFDANGEIHWSKNSNPRRKVYLPTDKSLPLTDYWDMFKDAHHQSIKITGYPTEKNLDLVKTIIGASSNPGDLVLDPFAGSGTTLHAAHDLQRSWIGIDESLTAVKTILTRMRDGLFAMGDYVERSPSADLLASLDIPPVVAKVALHARFDVIVDEALYEQSATEFAAVFEP